MLASAGPSTSLIVIVLTGATAVTPGTVLNGVLAFFFTASTSFSARREAIFRPPYFFQYDQQAWHKRQFRWVGPHAYHWKWKAEKKSVTEIVHETNRRYRLPGSIGSMSTIRTVYRNCMQWHRCSNCHLSCCHSVCWHHLLSWPLSMYCWWSLRSVCCSSECRLVSISIRHQRPSIAFAEHNDRSSSTCNSIQRCFSMFSKAAMKREKDFL